METKKIDSKIDDVAAKTKHAAAKAQDKGGDGARKGAEVVQVVKAGVRGATKTLTDGVQETAEKAGHSIQEAATKTADVAHEVTQRVLHDVQEAATKIEHRGRALVDKAGDKPKAR